LKFEIELSNPLDKNVVFDCSHKGAGLSGESSILL
jgi:hypothetical protein